MQTAHVNLKFSYINSVSERLNLSGTRLIFFHSAIFLQ